MKFNLNIDDIKYIKLLYREQNNSPANIKAAIKSINERELIACVRYEELIEIKTPQTITLSIICNDGLYRTQTTLKSVSVEEPYIFFYIETPTGLEHQQNREYFRILAEYDCSYIVTVDDEVQTYVTKTFDISANGVSIMMPAHVFSEEDADLDIMVDERIVHTKIRYIRSEKLDNGYKLSFTFSNISNSDRDYISGVCIKKQLDMKRKTAS